MPLTRRRQLQDTLLPDEPTATLAPTLQQPSQETAEPAPSPIPMGPDIPPPIPLVEPELAEPAPALPPPLPTEPFAAQAPLKESVPAPIPLGAETTTGGVLPGEPPPAGNTGGHQSPALDIPTPFEQAPSGYDPDKWLDPFQQTPKYVVGRLMWAFGGSHADPAVRDQVIAQLQAVYPGLEYLGGDKVDFPGIGVIDIYAGSATGLWEPAWQDLNDPTNGEGVPSGPSGLAPSGAAVSPPGGGSVIGGGGSGALLTDFAPQLNFSNDPGVFPDPVQPVGEDPLSQLITAGLASLIEGGGSPLGGLGGDLTETVRGLLQRGGQLDEDRLAARFESSRELLDRGRRAQVNQARGELANRNLLSEPGIPQGSERTALERIELGLAPIFATELRNIGIAEGQAADQRLLGTLSAATGLADSQSRNLLDTLRTATDRQAVLSNIALGTLDRNIEWNRFLAEFGLQRDVVLEQLQSGRTDELLALISLFNQFANTARSGQVQ